MNNEHAHKRPLKTALLVAGMHRSGTSALTRSVALCGFSLPNTLTDPAAPNPTGYWESSQFISLHDKILHEAGSRWDALEDIDPRWFRSRAASRYRKRLMLLMKMECQDAEQVVIKDPRICKLLPLWIDALHRSGFAAKIVIPLRHPIEVAKSLQKRNSFPITKGLHLWARYTLSAERTSRAQPRQFLEYDALLSDPAKILAQLGVALGIDWTIQPQAACQELTKFLRPELRHNRIDGNADMLLRELSADIGDLWNWLKDAAAGARPDTAAIDKLAIRITSAAPTYTTDEEGSRMSGPSMQDVKTTNTQASTVIARIRSIFAKI